MTNDTMKDAGVAAAGAIHSRTSTGTSGSYAAVRVTAPLRLVPAHLARRTCPCPETAGPH